MTNEAKTTGAEHVGLFSTKFFYCLGMENRSVGKSISSDWSRLTVSNNLGYLPIIYNYVGSIAEHVGFNAEECKRIELATEEVATNVIE